MIPRWKCHGGSAVMPARAQLQPLWIGMLTVKSGALAAETRGALFDSFALLLGDQMPNYPVAGAGETLSVRYTA